MKTVKFDVEHVSNGYVVSVPSDPSTHIAKSREEVGKVVVGILNEVFKEPHDTPQLRKETLASLEKDIDAITEIGQKAMALQNPKAKTPVEAGDE